MVAILALVGAFFALAAAQPAKRDVAWMTEWDVSTTVIPVYTTIWVQPGESVPAGQPAQYHPQGPPSSAQASWSPPANTWTTSTSTSAAATPTYVPSSSSSSSEAAPTYAPSSVSSSSSSAAPTYTPPPSSSSSSAPAASSSQSSSSGGSGITSGPATPGSSYSGDMTYYSAGMGACGITNTDEDDIVAVGETLFDTYVGGNPNLDPICGMKISITGVDGQSYPATITDRCPGCSEFSLDLTPSLFKKVSGDNMGAGRLHNVAWSFD